MSWKTGIKPIVAAKTTVAKDDSGNEKQDASDSGEKMKTREPELYFDDNEMRWKTRERVDSPGIQNLTEYEAKKLSGELSVEDQHEELTKEEYEAKDKEDFLRFFAELKKEMANSGEGDVNEEEAKELFRMMRDDFDEMLETPMDDLESDQLKAEFDALLGDVDSGKPAKNIQDEHFSSIPGSNAESDSAVSAFSSSSVTTWPQDASATSSGTSEFLQRQFGSATKVQTVEYDWGDDGAESVESVDGENAKPMEPIFTETVEAMDEGEVAQVNVRLEILREALPLFPEIRLKKILKAFQKSLTDPSILELVPLVREVMPDYITNTWLKKMSALTAKFVVHKAKEDGLLDRNILNSALSLLASTGSIDRTLDFHQMEFQEHGFEPNEYSNRLVLQMLLNNNRLLRALDFKRKLEESGQILDLKSYGSLLEYASRRQQMGTALLVLKECLKVHDAPPGEQSLAHLRILCRRAGKKFDTNLVTLIGPDPNAWVKETEKMKRWKHRKGAHGNSLQFARNQLVRLTG